MKKLILGAMLALGSTAASADVLITFSGTTAGGSSYTQQAGQAPVNDSGTQTFAGTLTVFTGALGANQEVPPDTSYFSDTAPLLSLSLTSSGTTPVLTGVNTASEIYSNGSSGSFDQQNDNGSTTGSFFYLYNGSASGATPSAVFGGVRLPDFRTLASIFLVFENNDGTTTKHVDGRVTSIAYAVTGAVPEPGSWAMMIGGLGLVGGTMRRRNAIRIPA